ncbi:MAG: 23S rRNA (uracil(1939)-C(5))-methyltransferase RlmD [Flavobacteriales bacterium]|jgi:23S rRNA (uracil-5-)-methyltransferase RumA|nr:23S rRNA (uracil(1939)-C(5))-methyltransferase RlmD [Flavobacteriales bacterium]
MFKRGERLELRIKDMAFGGKGIAKIPTENGQEFTVFVPNTLPNQLVEARVSKCQKRYAEAKLERVLETSPDEIEIPYQEIPGAPYARLPIAIQEKHKKDSCFHLFKSIGKIENIEEYWDTFISSPSAWHYRNKMEYSFSAIGWDRENQTDVDAFSLGFKKRGTWWMVENLGQDSGLFDAQFENHLKDIRSFLLNTGLPAWHPPKKEGFFRHLVVRKSYANDQILVMLVTSSSGLENFDKEAFASLLKDILGNRLAGYIHTINDEIGDRTLAVSGSSELIYGENVLVESICGLDFQMKMQSFFQTNPQSAERLYTKAIDYLFEEIDPEKPHLVMDLFCGTGTISQIIAKRAHQETQIIGVEIVEEAIADAQKNAQRNGIEKIEFYANDVGKFLLDHPHYKGKIDGVVLDPPRAGIAPKTLKKVINLGAQKMVYVSCNPATQARDLESLRAAGYQIKKFSLVDQFPHTSHVESVFLLSL